MKHMKRLLTEVTRRRATTSEVTEKSNTEFLSRVIDNLEDSVFVNGSCSTARSYYFNMAALLPPTSTINAFREASRFRLNDYSYA
jgi:hypothetical protein